MAGIKISILSLVLFCTLSGCLVGSRSEGTGESRVNVDLSNPEGGPLTGTEPGPIKYALQPKVIPEKVFVSRDLDANTITVECDELCLSTFDPPTANFCVVLSPYSRVQSILTENIPTETIFESVSGSGGSNGAVLQAVQVSGSSALHTTFQVPSALNFDVDALQVVNCTLLESTPEGRLWDAHYSTRWSHASAAVGLLPNEDTPACEEDDQSALSGGEPPSFQTMGGRNGREKIRPRDLEGAPENPFPEEPCGPASEPRSLSPLVTPP